MKRAFFPLLAVVLIASSAFMMAPTVTDWKIKDDYSIKFISSDPTGVFKTFKGTMKFDANDLGNSKFDLKVDVNSINTGNGMQNKKALTAEWFDATKYPQITFTSSKFEKAGNDLYNVSGTLKIKGTSKTYKIPFEFKENGGSGKFTGKFNVKRSDFKIGKPGGNVPDVMKIEFSVPVTK